MVSIELVVVCLAMHCDGSPFSSRQGTCAVLSLSTNNTSSLPHLQVVAQHFSILGIRGCADDKRVNAIWLAELYYCSEHC